MVIFGGARRSVDGQLTDVYRHIYVGGRHSDELVNIFKISSLNDYRSSSAHHHIEFNFSVYK